jgi:hypothetical protein
MTMGKGNATMSQLVLNRSRRRSAQKPDNTHETK